MALTRTHHLEPHFTETNTVRDIVIGMSDGLTVPFALAAGISGAGVGPGIVVTAGLAEIAAGSIAMGLGGYLAARTDDEHYKTEQAREYLELKSMPEEEIGEVVGILEKYGLSDAEAHPIADSLSHDQMRMVDFMMRFELGLEKPKPSRARQSAITIALSYIVGGFIPLAPYLLLKDLQTALLVSILFTSISLFVFGMVKGYFTGTRPLRSGFETVITGGIAAGVAFVLAKWIKGSV